MDKATFEPLTKHVLDEQFRAHAEDLRLRVDVLGDGPINAEVAIVGEGPGETEVRLGRPFVGGSGNLMWNTLRAYGINRANCYVTNVVKRQVSLSRKGNERHVVLAEELDRWVGMLQWELGQLPHVRTILILGNYALHALTKCSGILKWRGSVLPAELPNRNRGRFVVTINPAYALRELKLEPVFKMDCHKFSQVVSSTFKEHHITHIINPSYSEARALLRDLDKSNRPIAYDIEAINGETACHGFSNDPHVGICINLRDHARNRFTAEQEADLLLDIQHLCDSHRIIAQNGSFDSYWTRLHDWLSIKVWFDVLLAHHTMYPQLPHNLGFLCAQYTNHPFYKDEGKDWKEGGNIDEFWRYNCKDTAITYACYERLQRELHSQNLDKFFFEHVMRAQPHLVSATVHGVAVDMEVRDKINKLCAEDVAKLKAEFYRLVHEATGDDEYFPNPNSPQQLRELFFNRLRLQGRGTSTDEDNREHMLQHPNTSSIAKEILVALDKYKKEDKFYGTYAQAEVSADGRFRCEYKQYGVSNAPGRLSSAALLTGEGGNMQNQPVRARGMYIADEGCVFCYFDLTQAESQVVSFRADISKWKEQYARARKDGSYDAHRALASEMFKVPYDQVPVEDWQETNGVFRPTIRYTAKRCRHALNYRMERFRLSEVTGLPYHTAAHAFTVYHTITPELMEWWKEEERLFKSTREVYNALGRRFRVIQRIDEDVLKSIVAFFPQSTIGDKITQVWYQAEEDDDWPDDARIAIDVHDNLVAIASEKTAKTCLRIMKKHAESPIWIQDVFKRRKHEPLIIPAELKISVPSSWDEAKRAFIADPNGLHRWSYMERIKL
jgi:uracil-DNA glycosylase family 4